MDLRTWKYKLIPLDSMVMPRSCSSSRESKYRTLPANLLEIIPFEANSESDNVVFPWSTWARIQIFRIFLQLLCSSCNLAVVTVGIYEQSVRLKELKASGMDLMYWKTVTVLHSLCQLSCAPFEKSFPSSLPCKIHYGRRSATASRYYHSEPWCCHKVQDRSWNLNPYVSDLWLKIHSYKTPYPSLVSIEISIWSLLFFVC